MNCKDFEPLLFTYAELSNEEKNKLHDHLIHCSQCYATFQEVNEMLNRVSSMAQQKEPAPHAARLTNKIMTEINKPAKISIPQSISSFLQSRITKYSLSTVSCVLLLMLLIEVLPKEPTAATSFDSKQIGSVVLSSKAFRESFQKNKSKAPSYADCRSPFRKSDAILECVKNKVK